MREAGKIARSYFGGTFNKWDKAKGSPVTDADLAVDKFLRETLCAARPDYGWLSEETEDDAARLKARATFVVDPIDGTIAFIKAKPHFTICAGVVVDGVAVAGAIYNPITEECFTAEAGGGAFLNGTPIHPTEQATVEGCRMLADKPMLGHPAWNTPPNRPWPGMTIENRSSVAYRIVLVAAGQFDAMLALSSKRDWDLAAADVIAREAGALVTTHTGAPLRYNQANTLHPSVVVAGPKLHAQLMERVGHLSLPRG